MLRRKVVMMVAAAAVGLGIAGGATSADAATTLKFGTLAPANSPWAKGFKQLATDVAADTNGELQLDFQWNGQAGDEVLMVQKIRSGQLDGAAVTAMGLAQTGVSDVLLFQLPGLFQTWSKLDAAREATKDEFNHLFEQKGFTILGWGDVGAAKSMSVGFQIHHPTDLQGKGVFFLPGDPVQPKVFQMIGGITPKQLGVQEILPGLSNGSVNIMTVPPLVAEQFQWVSRVTDISSETSAFAIGAVLLSAPRVQSLPPKLRDALLTRGKASSEKQNMVIRNADAAAFERMKKTKTVYSPTDAEQQEWKNVFVKVAQSLRGPFFTPAMFDKVVALSGNTFLK